MGAILSEVETFSFLWGQVDIEVMGSVTPEASVLSFVSLTLLESWLDRLAQVIQWERGLRVSDVNAEAASFLAFLTELTAQPQQQHCPGDQL